MSTIFGDIGMSEMWDWQGHNFFSSKIFRYQVTVAKIIAAIFQHFLSWKNQSLGQSERKFFHSNFMFCKNNFDKVTNLFGDVEERLVWDEILAMSLRIGHCAVADRAINHFAGRARRHYHYCCCQQAPWDKKEEIAYVWRDEHFCVCPFAEKTNNYLQDTLRRIRGFLSTRNHLFCYKHVYAWIKSVKTKPRRRTNNYHFLSSSSVCCPWGHFFLWERE